MELFLLVLQDILYCKSTDLRFCNVIEKKHKSFALVQELYHSKIVPEIDTRSVEDYTVEIQRQEKEIIAVEEAIQNRINDLQSLARQYDETEDELKQEYQKYSRLLGEYNNKLGKEFSNKISFYFLFLQKNSRNRKLKIHYY